MNRQVLAVLALPVFAGCLGQAPVAPVHWTVEFARSEAHPGGSARKFGGGVRLSSLEVRAPYAGTRFAVLREDGSVAFDSYNDFAVSPASLLKGAAEDALAASGRFDAVCPVTSSARTRYQLEIEVTTLALDCRGSARPAATVALSLRLLEGREAVSVSCGRGVDDADGDFSKAFSNAFAKALEDALGALRVQ